MIIWWQRLVGLALVLAVGLAPAVSAQEQRTFSQQDLDRLLAPVALYPDALLSQILMAATYPLEVAQAARWVQANPGLRSEAREQAVANQDWDPSVKALVAVPQVLDMMSERLDWTERLGDAVLAQQEQVLATVQQLRRKAQEAGNLTTTRQQTVVVEPDVIVIEPADPEVVYVPVYNPTVIYGGWWWPALPYVWYPRTYVASSGLVAGVSFGLGISVGNYLWGGFDWHRHRIHVHRDRDLVRNITINRRINIHREHAPDGHVRRWEHDPSHRRGVRYRDPGARERYAGPPAVHRGPQDGRAGRPHEGWQVSGPRAGGRDVRPPDAARRVDPRQDALRQRLRALESPSSRAARGEGRDLPPPTVPGAGAHGRPGQGQPRAGERGPAARPPVVDTRARLQAGPARPAGDPTARTGVPRSRPDGSERRQGAAPRTAEGSPHAGTPSARAGADRGQPWGGSAAMPRRSEPLAGSSRGWDWGVPRQRFGVGGGRSDRGGGRALTRGSFGR